MKKFNIILSLISESETHILYRFITHRVKYLKRLFLKTKKSLLVDQHQQMTWQPKSSLTVETSLWTSSNMDSMTLHCSSRLWDLDFQMKYKIDFHLKRGLWTTEQQSSYFSL